MQSILGVLLLLAPSILGTLGSSSGQAPVVRCYHRGQYYGAEDAVPGDDACSKCQCQEGPFGALVVCAALSCGHLPCVDSTVLPGQCCPSCPNGPSCQYAGTLLRSSAGWQQMESLSRSCGIWCRCEDNGDLQCKLKCV